MGPKWYFGMLELIKYNNNLKSNDMHHYFFQIVLVELNFIKLGCIYNTSLFTIMVKNIQRLL